MADVPMLIISGTVGAGKTTLAYAVSEQLAAAGVVHCCVDADTLTATFPRPVDDPFGSRMLVQNLAAVWANAVTVGAQRLVVPRVVEDRADVDALVSAVPGAVPMVVRVVAPAAVVEARLVSRESGSARDWHVQRAPVLAAKLDSAGVEDLTVENNDRRPGEVAAEILAGWEARLAARDTPGR